MKQIRYFGDHRISFLEHELNWKYAGDNFSTIDSIDPEIANVRLIGNSALEVRKLRALAPHSVWVYLYADETYNIWRNFLLLSCGSVIGVIRPYRLPSFSIFRFWRNFCTALDFELKILGFRKSTLIFRNIIEGVILTFRQQIILSLHFVFRKQYIPSLLGYTNRFCEIRNSGKSQFSIRDQSFVSKAPINKKYLINFVGQKGRNIRFQSATMMKREMGSLSYLLFRENFGGNSISEIATQKKATKYVKILENSRFTFCPPGNYANETFRFLESLASGSIPVLVLPTLSDPLYMPLIDLKYPSIIGIDGWHSLKNVSPEQEKILRDDFRREFLHHVLSLNNLLTSSKSNSVKGPENPRGE